MPNKSVSRWPALLLAGGVSIAAHASLGLWSPTLQKSEESIPKREVIEIGLEILEEKEVTSAPSEIPEEVPVPETQVAETRVEEVQPEEAQLPKSATEEPSEKVVEKKIEQPPIASPSPKKALEVERKRKKRLARQQAKQEARQAQRAKQARKDTRHAQKILEQRKAEQRKQRRLRQLAAEKTRRRRALQRKIVKKPIVIRRVKPVYPYRERKRGVEGRVMISFTVLKNGLVSGARVTRSSGSALLDRAALTAVKKWKCKPARNGLGLPVSYPLAVPIGFTLEKN